MIEWSGFEGKEEGGGDALVDGVFGYVDEEEREHTADSVIIELKLGGAVGPTMARRGNELGEDSGVWMLDRFVWGWYVTLRQQIQDSVLEVNLLFRRHDTLHPHLQSPRPPCLGDVVCF